MEHGIAPPFLNTPKVAKLPQPAAHRVLIDITPPKDDSPGSLIYIPESVREKPSQGTIVAVGDGRRTPEGKILPVIFKAGQVVVFNRYSGTAITFNKREYSVISEDEIICIL